MAVPRLAALGTLFRDLRRRGVVRVALVYGVIGFGVLEAASEFFPALNLPAWTVSLVAALVVLGFPIALVLAWAFEITPDSATRAEPPVPTAGQGLPGPHPRPSRGVAYLGIGTLLAIVGVSLAYRAITREAAGPSAAGVSTAEPAESDEPVRSIAVLPFASMSTDAENEAFSDGLTEELLNVLARVRGLRVPARTSSFAFKNQNLDIKEIGRRLGVEVVLEGSVRKADEQLRITAQLIDVADGSHLWSERYDRELADIFAIQEEIAEAIVGQLLPRFAPGIGGTDFVHPTTEDVDAYQSYLQGRHQFWQQGGEEGLRRAVAFFEVAIEEDPNYAIAHAGLADVYMLLGGSGFMPPRDVFPQSKVAALRALELDSRLSEGYVALASINWLYDWDWAAADRNYRLSFSVNPLLHTRCICYAWYLVVTGDTSAAVLEAERARSMDPLARLPRIISGWMYYLAGRYDDAQEQLEELFALNPNDASARRIAAWMAWDRGQRDEAIEELEKLAGSADQRAGFADRGSPVIVAELATMYARTGRTAEAKELLDGLEARAGGRYIPPEYIAAIHGALGRHDEAFRWLEEAFANRSNLAQFNVLPLSGPLRDHRRYQALLARIGLPSRRSRGRQHPSVARPTGRACRGRPGDHSRWPELGLRV